MMKIENWLRVQMRAVLCSEIDYKTNIIALYFKYNKKYLSTSDVSSEKGIHLSVYTYNDHISVC